MAIAACSSSTGGASDATGSAEPPGTPAAVPSDLGATVDEIVTMLLPAADARRPDGFILGDGTVLASRPILRAPDGTGGFVELWILQVKMGQQAGGELQECRAIFQPEGPLSATCRGPDPGPPSLVQMSTSGDESTTVEMSGPADMTHFVVTAGDRRIALIPIAGEAVLRLDGGCPRPASVAAWRGDELIREEPGLMC